MATLTIRNLDDDIRDQLRLKAAQHGRSMEEEARVTLRAVFTTCTPLEVWQESRRLFSGQDGVELDLPDRTMDRLMPDFS